MWLLYLRIPLPCNFFRFIVNFDPFQTSVFPFALFILFSFCSLSLFYCLSSEEHGLEFPKPGNTLTECYVSTFATLRTFVPCTSCSSHECIFLTILYQDLFQSPKSSIKNCLLFSLLCSSYSSH